MLFIYSSGVFAFLPSQEELNADKIRKASFSVEVWKRPINHKTGRRVFGERDSLISRGVAVHLGKGYLLTALHIMLPIVTDEKDFYVKVIQSDGKEVGDLSLSRCEQQKGSEAVDLCLMKGNVKVSSFIEFPKDIGFTPSKEANFSLINQNKNHAEIGKMLDGTYIKKIVPQQKDDGYNGNRGVEVYRTNIRTAKANSGSVVFDKKTNRILGVTTNAVKVSRTTASEKESWLEAEVIPSPTVRRFLNTPGWISKRLPPNQTSYLKENGRD